MVMNYVAYIALTQAIVLSQILAGRYEFWDYYGPYVYDYSGNSRHAEIANSGTIPVLTDRGLYISDGYTLKFPQNSYNDFPDTCTDMVVSVLFYPKTDKKFCLIKLIVGANSLKVCFTSETTKIKISLEGSWNFIQTTTLNFNIWRLYTVRFSQVSGNTILYVNINGDSTNTALTFIMNSVNFAALGTKWDLGSNSIEGFLYQIWWHCQVTISIKTLSNSMIALPSSPCITLNALTPFRRCLSSQLDKFKNSENEDCTSCIASNQSCDKDQVCIDSCQYKCISPSGCRSVSYPICSTPTPTYCSAIPGTDICYICKPGWLMSMTTPGICEITIIGCKVFDSSARCTECQPGYYKTSTTPTSCIICPDGCEICTLNTSSIVVCSKCPSGQIIHTSPLCVSVCPPTFYENTLVNPSICESCQDGCKSCALNLSLELAICSECIEGYFLMNYMNSLTSSNLYKTECTLKCNLNYYGDSSATPPVCKPCRANCEICTNNTDCSQCIVGFMLSADNSTCLKCIDRCRTCLTTTICQVCIDSNYLDPITKKCVFCSWQCAKCADYNNCYSCNYHTNFITPTFSDCRVKCSHGSFLNGSIKTCAEYSANNLEVTYCSTDASLITTCNNCLSSQAGTSDCPATICPANCRKCNTVNGVVLCIMCGTIYFVQPDQITCLTTCPDFFHPQISSRTCIPCIDSCKRCIKFSNICEECVAGYSLGNNYASCVITCPARFYSDRTGIWRCMPCITDCNTCTNSSNCQRCLNNLYVVTSSTGEVSCESGCPPRSVSDSNKVCYYCNDNCDVCTRNITGVITCTTCSVGYILINIECIELKCDPNCVNCVISSITLKCDLCRAEYFIDPYGYKCLVNCPDGFYGNTSTKRCTPCMSNCMICQEASISNPTCTLCSPSYIFKDSYGVNICEYTTCPVSCTDCIITSPGIICNTCNATYFMQPNLPKCEISCPQGYYGDIADNTCKPCSNNCETCNMSGCIQCKSGAYLQPELICDISCPERYYNQDLTWKCIECPVFCNQCVLESDGVKCTECDETHYLRQDKTCDVICDEESYPNPNNNKCEKCSIDNCTACETNLSGSFICNRCTEDLYLYSSGNTTSCIVDCPDDYYKDDTHDIKRCSQCQEGCKICDSYDSCSECKESYYIQPEEYEIRCSPTCPDGYYGNSYLEIKKCSKCQDHCKRCISYDSCIECDDSYLIQPSGPIVCDNTCKQEFFPTKTRPYRCIPCFSNCLECDEDKCTKCKPLYIAKPPPVDNSDACLPCSKNCISCEYKDSKTVCTECDSGFYYQPEGYENELECDSKCPDGYYIDIFTISCKECPVGKYGFGTECIDCERPCTVCSSVDKCSECIENAVIVNDRCDCLSNFEFDGIECIERYFDLDLEFRNDTLIMRFEYPLNETLNLKYFRLVIEGLNYTEEGYVIESFDIQTYLIRSEIFLLNSDRMLIIQIININSFIDIFNHTLQYTQYSIQIPHFNSIETNSNPNPDVKQDQSLTETQQIRLEQTRSVKSSTVSTVRGASGVSIGIALINMNPANLWVLLNNIQILTYIPLLNMPTPPRTLGACNAFSSFNIIPNLFELFITKRETQLEARYTDNDINTVQLLINSGKSFTILLSLITLYILVKLISLATRSCHNAPKLKQLLNKTLRCFEWSIFIRAFIEAYMEYAFSSMLRILHPSVEDLNLFMDQIISWLFFAQTLIAPFYLLIFLLRNSSRLDSENFMLKWNSLYDGFKSSEYTIIFNVLFLARRFLYAACIVFLGSSPHMQLIICSIISYSIFYYIVIYKPYSSKKDNILQSISEGSTFISLCSLYAYNFDIGELAYEYLDYGIVIMMYLSFLIPVTTNSIEVIIKIIRKFRPNQIGNITENKYIVEEGPDETRSQHNYITN